MKIFVTGTRGIPKIQGGVETHCEELYPRLAKLGYEITLVRRSCYVTEDNMLQSYKGVKLKDIYAPKRKSVEAFVHTFLSVLYAKKHRTDILHIHAIGPSIMIPLARLLGLKVVVTNHGPDYNRKKWNRPAKLILKIGEYLGTRFSNELIVISEVINNIIKLKYSRYNAHVIYNGVNIPARSDETSYIHSLGLVSGKYVFALGRFVEEKGFDGLIEAFNGLNNPEYKLVIAGDADHPDKYSDYLKQLAKEKDVVMTGFIKGEKLNELFSHAQLFVLPSFHEGLPISLLEAMSYNADVLVSDIPANLEVGLSRNCYFKCGDWGDLKDKLAKKLHSRERPVYDLSLYNWDNIAKQTLEVYQKIYKKYRNI